jgi:hypothetical protein
MKRQMVWALANKAAVFRALPLLESDWPTASRSLRQALTYMSRHR